MIKSVFKIDHTVGFLYCTQNHNNDKSNIRKYVIRRFGLERYSQYVVGYKYSAVSRNDYTMKTLVTQIIYFLPFIF